MTDGIFATNPIPQATQAQMAADELLCKVRSEIDHRANCHHSNLYKFNLVG
jgi:hypothetical protein